MKAVGIVAEYNPFHNGHAYHIKMAKEQTGTDTAVCVMSGNFVQRGSPAIAGKWMRTRMALAGGADLVLELPCYFAMNTAEIFAYGGVATLDALGCVDYLCFGAESGDLSVLSKTAQLLKNEPQELSIAIQQRLDAGEGYPCARASALEQICAIPQAVTQQPNNILGIEYLRSLDRLGSAMKPFAVQRYKTNYHDITPCGDIASAAAIRQMMRQGDDICRYLPDKTAQIWDGAQKDGVAPVWAEALGSAVLVCLRSLGAGGLAKINDVAEGLEYRIYDAAMQASSISGAIDAAVSKRYTRARIARIVWSAFLGIQKPPLPVAPAYIRVLGMNSKGKALLAQAKTTATLPVIVKPADYDNQNDALFRLDVLATDLYSLAYANPEKRVGRADYTTSPVVMD